MKFSKDVTACRTLDCDAVFSSLEKFCGGLASHAQKNVLGRPAAELQIKIDYCDAMRDEELWDAIGEPVGRVANMVANHMMMDAVNRVLSSSSTYNSVYDCMVDCVREWLNSMRRRFTAGELPADVS